MLRINFDKLEVLEQVKYINNKLVEGHTLTNICKDVGIGRSTIRDRFKTALYEYDKDTKQYKIMVEVVEAKTPAPTPTATPGNEHIQNNLKVDTDILTSIINNYDDNLNKLNEIYNWYKLQSSIKVVATDKLNISDFEGDIVVRSYKLYEPIQKEFTEFCRVNNKYKVQDILSQFIKEGMERYK